MHPVRKLLARSSGGLHAGRAFATRLLPQFANNTGQVAAVDELHRVIMHAALIADGMDRHDIRMMQMRRGLRLVFEALQLLGIERRGQRQDLQGDTPAQGQLLGLVDDTHAAPAHLAQDAEVSQRQCQRTGLGRLKRRSFLQAARSAQGWGGGMNEVQRIQTAGQGLGQIRIACP